MAKLAEGEPTLQYKYIYIYLSIFHEQRDFGARFLSYGLLMAEEVFSVSTLTWHAGIAGDGLLREYLLPLYLTGAVYHDFL
jgi:hypothetical protein